MEYAAVVVSACFLQAVVSYVWKKDNVLELKKWIFLLFAAVSAVTCCYLFYFNADKMNFCKLVLVYFMVLSVSVYDWKEHKIPNKILITCGIVRIALFGAEFFYHKSLMKAILISCLGGAVLFTVLLLLLVLLTKQGFGMGDVKLFMMISFTIGLLPAYNMFFYSIVYTAVCSVFLLLVKKVGKKYKLPFAPFVYLGCLTIIFFRLY